MGLAMKCIPSFIFCVLLSGIIAFAQDSPCFMENFNATDETELMAAVPDNVQSVLGSEWSGGATEFKFAIKDKAETDFDKGLLMQGQTTDAQVLTRALDTEVAAGKYRFVSSFYCYLPENSSSIGIRSGVQISGGAKGTSALAKVYTTQAGSTGIYLSVAGLDSQIYSKKTFGVFYDIEIICDLNSRTMDINISWEGIGNSDYITDDRFLLTNDYLNNRAIISTKEAIYVKSMTKICSVALFQSCNSSDGIIKERQSFFDYVGFLPFDDSEENAMSFIVKKAEVCRYDSTGLRTVVELSPAVTDRAYSVICALYCEDNLIGIDIKNINPDKNERNQLELFIPFKGQSFVEGGTVSLFVLDNNCAPIELLRREMLGEYVGDSKNIIGSRHFGFSEYLPDEEEVKKRLNAIRGKHPRVLFSAEEWEDVRARFATLSTEDKTEIISKADAALATELYVYNASDEGQQRIVGISLEVLAESYMLTGDERYLNRAIEWAELASDSNRMPKYGDGQGIAAGTILYGLAIAYDILYDKLSTELKADMLNAMIEHGNTLLNSWQGAHSYLHNFNFIIAAGIGHTYYAIFDETDKVANFLPTVQRKLACAYAALGKDGCSPEGIGYWSYGFNMLGKCMFLSKKMWNFDPVEAVEEITKAVADYRLYMSFPENGQSKRKYVAYFGDCYGYDFFNNNLLYYYIASKKNLPVITWLAEQHRGFGYNQGDSEEEILSFYYRENAPPAVSPNELGLPAFKHFADYDMVVARSGWDGDESVVYFKCGANQGRKASYFARAFEDNYDLGAGHSHPDANHFILFGGGDQLLIDDEYTSKRTEQHNTLLVNGIGQIGSTGSPWYLPKNRSIAYNIPYIKKAESTDKYDYFVGAAANAYDEKLGLEKFDRHMLYVKEKNVLIIADDIKTKEPSKLELRFFPRHTKITEQANGFLVSGTNTMLVKNLTPECSTLWHTKVKVYKRNETEAPESEDETNADTDVLVVTKNTDALKTVTAFSWCEKGGTLKQVELEYDNGKYAFIIDDERFILDMKELQVKNTGSEQK